MVVFQAVNPVCALRLRSRGTPSSRRTAHIRSIRSFFVFFNVSYFKVGLERERERETERQRETETETETETERQRDRERQRQRDRETETETERQRE